MSDILKIIELNAVWKGNLKVASDIIYGSGHVIPKHEKEGFNLCKKKCFSLTKTSTNPHNVDWLFLTIMAHKLNVYW